MHIDYLDRLDNELLNENDNNIYYATQHLWMQSPTITKQTDIQYPHKQMSHPSCIHPKWATAQRWDRPSMKQDVPGIPLI
jgi:hypothetical protein